MNDFLLSLLCLAATLALYFANKRLYRRRRSLLLMPLVLTPMILVLLLVVTHISYRDYLGRPTGCCGCSARRPSPLRCRCMRTCTLSAVTGCRSAPG
ncbi:hypothetical protein GGER_47670 [Serratia rubidaea]